MTKPRDYNTVAEVCEFVVADAQVLGRKLSPYIHSTLEDVAVGLALAKGPFPVFTLIAAQRVTGRLRVETPLEKAVEVALLRDVLRVMP